MKLEEIATRIKAHLARFEADPEINTKRRDGTTLYWRAGSWSIGRYVYVQYIGYQGSSHLTKDEAEKYLSWLDEGNVGRHYRALENK